MSNIIRIEKKENFVVLDKGFLNNKKLSWKAKGILAYMLSKPNDWVFYIDELIKHATDGERSFRAGLKELTDHGHVERKPVREGQRISHWETIVYEKSLLCDPLHVQNVHVQSEDVQKQHVQNDALLSTDSTKNDSTKNNKDIYTVFNHWKEVGLMQHRELTQKRKSAINARLESYSVDELKQAIDNYKQILDSDNYYFTYKWSLENFMNPSNLERFTNEASPFDNFKDKSKVNNSSGNKFVPMSERYDPNQDAF